MAAGVDAAASFAYACMRRELCNGHCRPRPRPGCVAVGLQRKLNSNVLRLLQPLFAPVALPPARLVLTCPPSPGGEGSVATFPHIACPSSEWWTLFPFVLGTP